MPEVEEISEINSFCKGNQKKMKKLKKISIRVEANSKKYINLMQYQ